MQKIVTNLWFDDEAEEAANFYVSIFKNSKLGNITRYGDSAAEISGKPKGSVLTVDFEIAGQTFVALNGGPQFKFSEAISLQVNCEDQEEVDNLWQKLTADGGAEQQCGWLKDKYGLSWQIVPNALVELMTDTDASRVERAMKAMLSMKKLDIKQLLEAADGN